jgi:hypothetical protein
MIQIIINVLLILVPQYKWKDTPLLKAAFVSDLWGEFARGYEHDCTCYSLKMRSVGQISSHFPAISCFLRIVIPDKIGCGDKCSLS